MSLLFRLYVFFSNFSQRNFLIGTLPLIFKLDIILKSYPFKVIINLFFIKLIYSFIYSYFNVNDGIQYIDNQRVFSTVFIMIFFLKSIIDYLLMIVLTALSFNCLKIFYTDLKKKFIFYS